MNFRIFQHIKGLYLWVIIAGLSACKTGREYQRPALNLPVQFSPALTEDSSSMADEAWDIFFQDSTLKNLITQGLQYNDDLLLALNRIQAAQAEVKQARLNWLPEVDLQVSGQTSRPSDNSLNGLSASSLLGTHHIEDYSALASMSWEVDVWGKIRRQKEATIADYLGTFEAARAVQTRVVSDIASGYYNLLMLNEQMQIAVENLALNDSTLVLTRLEQQAGEVTLLAVQQSEAQRQSTAQIIPQLEMNITLEENALHLLTGKYPDTVHLPGLLSRLKIPDTLAAGVPASLVARRPDVRASEMSLVAANARVGVAQADIYPSLDITASGGLNSFKASNWFNMPASLFGLVAGTVAKPVFAHRQLKTQLEVARIDRQQAVITFRQSVLKAVGEVSEALVRIDKLRHIQQITSSRVENLERAVQNAQLLFKSGMATYLEVITAEQNALAAELDLSDVKRQRLSAIGDLYRALGGGWKSSSGDTVAMTRP